MKAKLQDKEHSPLPTLTKINVEILMWEIAYLTHNPTLSFFQHILGSQNP